jgi:hypothetical protein
LLHDPFLLEKSFLSAKNETEVYALSHSLHAKKTFQKKRNMDRHRVPSVY